MSASPTTPESLSDFRPGRLWSLWEMLKFNASPFIEVLGQISQTWIMVEQHIRGLEESERQTEEDGSRIIHFHYADEIAVRLWAERTRELIESLSQLKMEVTLIASRRLLFLLTDGKPTYEMFRDSIRNIRTVLQDELSLIKIYVLPSDKAALFEPTDPLFGNDVATKFVGATFEIDEAAKCLALGRPTASVFHLMRVMEFALRAAAQCLGLQSPIGGDRNWGNMLGAIAKAAVAKTTWSNPADKAFFAEVHASFDVIRVAWRNATMHVENKYTDDEAEHIFVAARGLMKKLASRMDENGQPLA